MEEEEEEEVEKQPDPLHQIILHFSRNALTERRSAPWSALLTSQARLGPPQVAECTERVPDLNSPPCCLILGHQETSRGKYRNRSPFIIMPDTESEDEAA